MEREEIEERNQDIAERFVRGQTYQQIGDKWGLTRERVRQILTKMGYKWYQGGAHVTAKERERREQNEKERSCRRRTGLSIRDKKRLAGKSGDPESPYRKFLDQRRNANERGIEWNLTFAAWWYLWCLYDCYDSRGRRRGEYVMARLGDVGPYSITNCKIITCTENIQERNTNKTDG